MLFFYLKYVSLQLSVLRQKLDTSKILNLNIFIMKKIFLTLGCFAALGFNTISAQNVLDKSAFGFETEVKEKPVCWWVVPAQRDRIMPTKEKAASGEYSLKISCQDFGDLKMIQAQSILKEGSKSLVSLKAGTYTVSLKVYVGEDSPVSFSTNILETKDSKFIPISWKLKGVEKNKWVELKQEVTFPKLKNTKMAISLSSNPKWGGFGTVYIDDIKIEKK